MNTVITPVRADWDEAGKSTNYFRGDEFEQYIRNTLFPRESFDVLFKTHDYAGNLDEYITYSKLPDYKFRIKSLGADFFIQAKFRAKFQDQVLEWCKLFQQKRWQEIDNVTPVLVVIGVGGRPTAPERVYLVPVRQMKFVKLYPGFLQKYGVLPDRAVSDGILKQLLK